MKITKTTQKELRRLVKVGIAKDITDTTEKIEGLRQTEYSAGVHGCNGMLLQDKNGQQYAIIGRTGALFLY